MKTVVIFVLIAFVSLSGCDKLKGPMGPQGEQGEQGEQGIQGENGENLEITDITGVLVVGDMINNDPKSYWDIELPNFSQTFFISVVIRAGGESSWWNPGWWGYAYYNSKNYARIYYEGYWVEPGYQYRISIAY